MSKLEKSVNIDVIIPTYNSGCFVLDAIRSIENQSLKPKKIIVVDDGSMDNTEEIIQKNTYSLPVIYRKKENGGPNSARNRGLEECTSEYVAFLDADDIWCPEKLREQISVFEQSPFSDLGAVYCGYLHIDSDGKDRPEWSIFRIQKDIRGKIFQKILPANRVASSASGILVKRACFDVVGNFDETLRVGEDWDMWLRIAEKFEYDYSDKFLVKIRKHSANTQGNEEYVFRNELSFYIKWANRLSGMGSCPKKWAGVIIMRIIRKIPNREFFDIARNILEKKVQKKIFWMFGGSMRLGMIIFLGFRYLRVLFSMTKFFLKSIFFETKHFICNMKIFYK